MGKRLSQKAIRKQLGISEETHRVWHKFSNWLTKTYGKDLWSEWKVMKGKNDATGKSFKFKYRHFNDFELSKRLTGYDVMCKVKKYINRCCPEIKIIHCDDAVFAGSDILLIPHPAHGITVMYIPQCTSVQNQFFLYKGHYTQLMKGLREMSHVYKGAL